MIFKENKFLLNFAGEGAAFAFNQINFYFYYSFQKDQFHKNSAKIGRTAFFLESPKIYSFQVNLNNLGRKEYIFSVGNNKGNFIFDNIKEEDN